MTRRTVERDGRGGFTLMELLCVVAVISIIAVVSVNSMQRVLLATNLTSSAAMVVDEFNLARQRAISENCPVEVRLYQVPDASGGTQVYRAIGLYQINSSGPQLVHKITYLNGNVVLSNSTTFGTLLASSATGAASLPNSGATAYPYSYFQFRPDGSTNLSPLTSNSDTWHVMLFNSTQPPSGTTPPANYISVQLDPVTGRTVTFQPGM